MNERLAKIRKEVGLTQEEFAKRVKISKNYICQLETGKKVPSERLVDSICREFTVNRKWLISGEGNMYISFSNPKEINELAKQPFNENDPFRKQLVKMISGMGKDELEAAKKLRDYISAGFRESGTE